MYKVFVNDKPIILTSSNKIEENFEHYLFEHISVDEIIYKLKNESIKGVVIKCNDLEIDFEKFKRYFKVVIAGGGLVRNNADEFLFIFRNRKWDLPKGRQEINESIEQTALREVEEECGLQKIELGKKITITYHIYFEKQYKLKETHWFEMIVDTYDNLNPQIEEGITKLKFLSSNKIEKVLPKTFANIVLVYMCFLRNSI